MATASSTSKKAPEWILNWEYCECGCKCYVASVGSMFFSIFIEVLWADGTPHTGDCRLSYGHRGGQSFIGTFGSFEEADRQAAALATKHVDDKLGELQKIKERLDAARQT